MDLLVDEGVTSFKLFMAYPGVFYSTDGEILQAMQQARATARRIMMHAENGIAIDVLVAQALARGEARPELPRPHAPAVARGRGDPPRHRSWPASPARRSTSSTCRASRLWQQLATARDRGQNVVRRDLPAVPVPLRGGHGRARVSRGQVRVLAAAARPRPPGRPVARACAPTTSASCPPTTARSASRSRRSSASGTSPRSRTGCRAWRTGWT